MITIFNGSVIVKIHEVGAYVYSLSMSGRDILLQGNLERPTRGGMAILIPFANRVKGGSYVWGGRVYELPRNEEGNAIHGLVLDKKFSIVELNYNKATLALRLSHPGYPTELDLKVSYTALMDGLEATIYVKNVGESDAPLVVGAHPYFIVRGHWSIEPMDVFRCVSVGKIPTGSIEPFKLIEGTYDDCFIIKGDVKLRSDYSTVVIEKPGMDYVQVYTVEGAIAVEPMSGAPDAYHNGMGLAVIKPGEERLYTFRIRAY